MSRIPFSIALWSIVIAVAIVGMVAVSGPLAGMNTGSERNIVGHPFDTGDDYDVALVSPEAVYTYTDAHYPPPGGYIPRRVFETITYLPGSGQFIVGGLCHPGGVTNPSYAQYAHKYGMYTITDTGELAATRDVCIDTSNDKAGDWCGAEGHSCTYIGTRTVALSDGRFLRENGLGLGARPATVHGASSNSIHMYARTPLLDVETAPPGTLLGFVDIAVANDRAIGMSLLPDYTWKNTIYSLPDLELVTSFDREYTPLVGVGDYFIAWRSLGSQAGRADSVYRMPTSGTAKPTLVSTFSGKTIYGFGVVDSLDPKRIGLVLQDKITNTKEFVIYNAGPDGLVEESRRPAPQHWGNGVTSPQSAMAGPYLVYGRCPSTSQLFEERAESCRVYVEKNGVELAVEQLPRDANGRRRVVQAVAISDTGRILMSTGGFSMMEPSAAAHLFLYQIRDFDDANPPGDEEEEDQTPPPTPGLPECFTDADCDLNSYCINNRCEAGCTSNSECGEHETCVNARCELQQLSTAAFTAETATCNIGLLRIFCGAGIAWTSTGSGVIQLIQEDGTIRACAPAGQPDDKTLITTAQAKTYQLYAATDCNSAPYRLLDTITVQGVKT